MIHEERGLRKLEELVHMLAAHTLAEDASGRTRPAVAGQAAPFVTISRQSGAGARTIAGLLVERLNQVDPEAGHPWTSWDRELVEKVASEHAISQELIDTLTEKERSWMDRFVTDIAAGLGTYGPTEFSVYQRVASTVRALARTGRVVLVGRGGMCITREMPGGLHVRLVAPVEHRVAEIERRRQLSHRKAAEYVRSVDHAREEFYRHYFPKMTFGPEQFGVTFNTSELTEGQIVDCLVTALMHPTARTRHARGAPTGVAAGATAGRA